MAAETKIQTTENLEQGIPFQLSPPSLEMEREFFTQTRDPHLMPVLATMWPHSKGTSGLPSECWSWGGLTSL